MKKDILIAVAMKKKNAEALQLLSPPRHSKECKPSPYPVEIFERCPI